MLDRTLPFLHAKFPILKKKSVNFKGGGFIGRPRKLVSMQTKHLTKEEISEKEEQENLIIVGREDLQSPPSWLIDSMAKKEFDRIVRNFEKIELIGNLDLNNIAGYCNAYSMYIRATKEFKQTKDLMIPKQMTNGAYTEIPNPIIKIQRQLAEEMRKFASLCGLTIDSRLKLAVQKTTKENYDIEEEFGGI